ncbi:MAG: MBL fold metallo-hydrolase [Treponema sp.]|jgi:7,8-dihydropterin-6-yl-methyl-4-(beta-D-ribofuranosyl)aminobenzene 5'-phosphate synthase|nr:MBL fold metallo-hydrolase [Treponema sp.]
MKVTILTDNATIIDRYFIGEPGFSVYVEDGNSSLLFDLGYSDVFLRNAQKMKIDFSELDFIAVSHGHCDHTGGLEPLMRYYAGLEFENMQHKRPILFAHPETFQSISAAGFSELGSLISTDKLAKFFDLRLDRRPQKITDRLLYLGEIPGKNDFEGKLVFGRKDGKREADCVPEDTAVVYTAKEGLVIITGCSHAGICNIVEYAKEITGERRIADIIGGFHLLAPDVKQMNGTLDYLKGQQLRRLHPCHCTDLKSKMSLATVCPVEEVGVGLKLEYD